MREGRHSTHHPAQWMDINSAGRSILVQLLDQKLKIQYIILSSLFQISLVVFLQLSMLEMLEAKTEAWVVDMESIVEKKLESRYREQIVSLQSKLEFVSRLTRSLEKLPTQLHEMKERKDRIDMDMRLFVETVSSSMELFKNQVRGRGMHFILQSQSTSSFSQIQETTPTVSRYPSESIQII